MILNMAQKYQLFFFISLIRERDKILVTKSENLKGKIPRWSFMNMYITFLGFTYAVRISWHVAKTVLTYLQLSDRQIQLSINYYSRLNDTSYFQQIIPISRKR